MPSTKKKNESIDYAKQIKDYVNDIDLMETKEQLQTPRNLPRALVRSPDLGGFRRILSLSPLGEPP